jgi:hypothetical protein
MECTGKARSFDLAAMLKTGLQPNLLVQGPLGKQYDTNLYVTPSMLLMHI